MASDIIEASDREEADSEEDFSFDESDSGSMFDFSTGLTTGPAPDPAFVEDEGNEVAFFDAHHIYRRFPLPLTGYEVTIRLLQLLPARAGDGQTLDCRLMTTTFEEPCLYQALSYAWGPPDTSETLTVDGVELNISQTLKAALMTVRNHWDKGNLDSERLRPVLWVDAICIDQQNNIERNRQVQHMGQIYAKAHDVLVWLGNSAEPIPEQNAIVPDARNNWFSRRWAVQEFLMQERRWFLLKDQALEVSVTWRSWQRLSPSLEVQKYAGTWSWRDLRASEGPLLLNLIKCCQTLCHDDRDRIYALRAISRDGHRFPVDYRCTTEEVFFNVASFYVGTEWLPVLLSAAMHFPSQGSRMLEGWVPDWRSPHVGADYPGCSDQSFSLRRPKEIQLRPSSLPEPESKPRIIPTSSQGLTALEVTAWIASACQHDTFHIACLHCRFCTRFYLTRLLETSRSGEGDAIACRLLVTKDGTILLRDPHCFFVMSPITGTTVEDVSDRVVQSTDVKWTAHITSRFAENVSIELGFSGRDDDSDRARRLWVHKSGEFRREVKGYVERHFESRFHEPLDALDDHIRSNHNVFRRSISFLRYVRHGQDVSARRRRKDNLHHQRQDGLANRRHRELERYRLSRVYRDDDDDQLLGLGERVRAMDYFHYSSLHKGSLFVLTRLTGAAEAFFMAAEQKGRPEDFTASLLTASIPDFPFPTDSLPNPSDQSPPPGSSHCKFESRLRVPAHPPELQSSEDKPSPVAIPDLYCYLSGSGVLFALNRVFDLRLADTTFSDTEPFKKVPTYTLTTAFDVSEHTDDENSQKLRVQPSLRNELVLGQRITEQVGKEEEVKKEEVKERGVMEPITMHKEKIYIV